MTKTTNKKGNQPMKTIGIIIIAVLFAACQTRMDNPHAQTTAALIQRQVELQQREADDDYGIMYGPTRWISHATDERASRKELQSINAELAGRTKS